MSDLPDRLGIGELWPALCATWFDEVFVLGRACSQEMCDRVAVVEVLWPGSPRAPMCARHTAKMARVAEALGFELATWPIPHRVRIEVPPDDTAIRFSLLELDG